MPQKPTVRQRLNYWFDNLMAGGTRALLIGLFVLSAFIIFTAAMLVKVTHSEPNHEGLLKLIWMGLLRTLDSGTMGNDEGNGIFLSMMFFVTLGGVFVVSALIGILNHGLEAQLSRMRKGRSLVLESGHTVILGWTPQVFTILSELIEANSNRTSGAVVVILSSEDKVDMEDAIRERIPDHRNTKIICRSGSPIDLNDIEIVSPHTARSIIILPEGDDPDAHVIKSVLALTNNPKRRAEPYHIVTQIRDPKNMQALDLIGKRDLIQPVLMNDLIARVVAQTSRQSGLSTVYTELLNFSGDEIYFANNPALNGMRYGDALLTCEDSAVMGIFRANGSADLNPPADAVFAPGDAAIVLTADDDTFCLTSRPAALEADAIRTSGTRIQPGPEKCLILGWNPCGATILRELDAYVAPGSFAQVVSGFPKLAERVNNQIGTLNNQTIKITEGDITERSLLESLEAHTYHHVIVLADKGLDPQKADARTLVTLLHLRDIALKNKTPFSIVSEMLDLRNRELAEAAQVDDFIISEHLISLLMAQLSEDRRLFSVFKTIFSAEGAEIYLKPIGDYVETGRPLHFATLAAAASQHGETAIGYRLMRESHDARSSYGVHTNPKKSALITFAPEDKAIVLADQ